MSTEKVQHEYGADEIQILEGLEAVRKRPEYVYQKHICKRIASSCL